MSRFIIFLLILINNSVIGQSINGFVVRTQTATPVYATTGRNLTDSGPVRQLSHTNTTIHTAKVIIFSKGICKQSVSLFFIVNIPDTLVNQPTTAATKDAATIPTREARNAPVSPAENITTGGGSDYWELLLKTPGRLTGDKDIAEILMKALPSLWPVLSLSR